MTDALSKDLVEELRAWVNDAAMKNAATTTRLTRTVNVDVARVTSLRLHARLLLDLDRALSRLAALEAEADVQDGVCIECGDLKSVDEEGCCPTCGRDAMCYGRQALDRARDDHRHYVAQANHVAKLEAALAKINNIRNSIVGLQTINWSEHIYPLVAALDEAGVEGLPYEQARPHFGTMLERTVAAEDRAATLEAENAKLRAVADGARKMLEACNVDDSRADSVAVWNEGYGEMEAALEALDGEL